MTADDIIVSCSDCSTPSVKFYDHDLELIHTEYVERNVNTAYELAVHDQRELSSVQTYIAGGGKIQILLQKS